MAWREPYVKLDPKVRQQRKADRKRIREYKYIERRAAISRYTAMGWSTSHIANRLGVSPKIVRKSKAESLARLIARTPGGVPLLTAPPRLPTSSEEEQLRKTAFGLRKRSIAYGDIARHLKVEEKQVRSWVRQELARLEDEDLQDVNHARRLQLEQIEAMMAAIMTPATGRRLDGKRVQPQYEAIDRMIKLMEMKAKLLGLNAPQVVDINNRLEIMAIEFSCDLDQLKDIARDVIAQRLGTKSLKSGT
jgi:transposase-like protein